MSEDAQQEGQVKDIDGVRERTGRRRARPGKARFRPDALYSLDEVAAMLEGVVALGTFLDRLGLRERRVFKSALWGWEILDAARRAPPFSQKSPSAGTRTRSAAGSGGGRRRGEQRPAGRLSADDL